jgi:hypothetical protein
VLVVLLFVFWYCHKRGREVRLEKERQFTEEEVQKLDVEFRAENPGERPATTAKEGASIEDVKAGMKEIKDTRQAAEVSEHPVEIEKPVAAPAAGTTTAP